MRHLGRRDRAALLALVVLTATTYGTYALLRHANFMSSGFDLGIFDQAVRGYSRFEAPDSSLKGPDFNLLGNHFHPILVVLAPLYWLWDDPGVLLLAQAALVASSVVPVYAMARARLDSWCAATLGLAYAFSWPIQALVDFDFHEVAFALPLLAWTIYLLDLRKGAAALAVAFSLLLVREDMGLVLVALAGVLAIRRHWRAAAATAVAGTGAYYLVTGVVIPALAPGTGFTYWSYDALGPDLPSAVRFLLTNPIEAARIFLGPTKRRTLSLLLLASGVVSVGSPYALLAVPLLAEHFLSSRVNLWTTNFHYNAPLAVIGIMSLIDVLGRLRTVALRLTQLLAATLAVTVVAGTFVDPELYPLWATPRLVTGLDSTRVHHARATIAAVPHGVCVEADDRLVPHLTPTNDVVLPGESAGVTDWLLLDMSQVDPGGEAPIRRPPEAYFAEAAAAGYAVVETHGPFIVLHRPGPEPRRNCFPQIG